MLTLVLRTLNLFCKDTWLHFKNTNICSLIVYLWVWHQTLHTCHGYGWSNLLKVRRHLKRQTMTIRVQLCIHTCYSIAMYTYVYISVQDFNFLPSKYFLICQLVPTDLITFLHHCNITNRCSQSQLYHDHPCILLVT